MRLPVRLSLALAVLAVPLGLMAPVGPASADPGTPALTSGVTPGTTTTGDRAVPLLTGEVVRLSATGDVRVAAAPGADVAAVQTVRAGSRVQVVPRTAVPYLGRYLDPALFDVAAQAAVGGGLAVALDLEPGAQPHLPGVTLTRSDATTATGSLTAAGAQEFGRALAEQYAQDARTGWTAPPALFAGVRRLVAARAAPPAPAAASVRLQVRVLDERGRPAPGASLYLVNTDDATRYAERVPLQAGTATVTVPPGHYSALASVDAVDQGSGRLQSRFVSQDADVRAGAAPLVLDARAATTPLRLTTPRPAAGRLTATWERRDRSGRSGISVASTLPSDSDVRVAPTAAARTGSLRWSTQWGLDGEQDGRAYRYDVAFSDPRIPAEQTYAPNPAQLASVTSRYFADGGRDRVGFARLLFLPGQSFAFGTIEALAAPRTREEYLLAPRGAGWATSVDVVDGDLFTASVSAGRLQSYAPGQHTHVDWLRPALLPRVLDDAVYGLPCGACRRGDELTIGVAALTDSTRGHLGYPSSTDAPTVRARLFRGDRLLADESDVVGITATTGAAAAQHRLVYDVDRGPGTTSATRSHTELTFRSAAGDGAACGAGCRVLPLLQVRAPLPVDLGGRLPLGTSAFDLQVEHVAGAPRTPIRSATVEVRGQGAAWTAVPVTLSPDGEVRARLTGTAATAGQWVDLRVTATDSIGGSISQTLVRAYRVAES